MAHECATGTGNVPKYRTVRLSGGAHLDAEMANRQQQQQQRQCTIIQQERGIDGDNRRRGRERETPDTREKGTEIGNFKIHHSCSAPVAQSTGSNRRRIKSHLAVVLSLLNLELYINGSVFILTF